MASKTDLNITIIGAGTSKFGLHLLGIVARVFDIRLEVVCPTQRALDGAKYCACDVFVADYLRCKNCGLPEAPRR